MTYATFSQAVRTGFQAGFFAARPSFPQDRFLWEYTQKTPPDNATFIRAVLNDLGAGEFTYIGSPMIEQTALLTADVYVPMVSDLLEIQSISQDLLEVIKFLVLPNNGFKRRLGKRDFANSLGGFAHSRVSVTLIYDA